MISLIDTSENESSGTSLVGLSHTNAVTTVCSGFARNLSIDNCCDSDE